MSKTPSSNTNQTRYFSRLTVISAIAILVLLALTHVLFWPRLLLRMDNALKESPQWNSIRLCLTMWDGIYGRWYPQAAKLMDLDTLSSERDITRADIEETLKYQGVLDAFYLDFNISSGVIVNKTLSLDSLQKEYDLRGTNKGGGAARMTRRIVGGLVRFSTFKYQGESHLLLIRYIGGYYPSRSDKIVGLVIDKEWFVKQVPDILDSLAANNTNLLFAAPPPSDTSRFVQKDPWAAPNDSWKQVLAAKSGNDTLWWFGDPNVDVCDRSLMTGNYMVWLDEFDVTVFAKADFPGWHEEVVTDFRKATIYLVLLEVLGILLVIILFRSRQLSRRMAERNQIALAHLTHAIKTPIARIRLNTDSLLEEMVTSPEEERDILQSVNQECKRMEHASRSAVIAMNTGKLKLDRKLMNLNDLVTDVCNSWQIQFRHQNIKLEFESPGHEVNCKIDKEMFTTSLDNLLDNALRHTILNRDGSKGSSSKVVVRLGEEKRHAVINVDDSGGGIPNSERKVIFKRFQRVSGDAASGVSGLGLGLSIVKEIITAHEGEIFIEDNDLGGARFVIRLPLN